ncbi:MAG TPA: four helix bundle protein [Bacteroidetes bacterium]|jgi:four helix bundle protein|nr:four helix bundle protein [Bacteroidota bacterium]
MIDEGYKKLEVYQMAHRLAVEVHQISLGLPKHEMYEQGSQIRRSSKSVSAQIVEGYCLRKHKNEFLLYLNRAYASAGERIEHLELLFETKSLTDEVLYLRIRNDYEQSCGKLFRFIQAVNEGHEPPRYLKEDGPTYAA